MLNMKPSQIHRIVILNKIKLPVPFNNFSVCDFLRIIIFRLSKLKNRFWLDYKVKNIK